MEWIWQALLLFVVTNIDDVVVLGLFFGRADRTPGSTRRIVLGQYLGFTAILGVSVAAAFGAGQLPGHLAAYLGLIPLAIGLHEAYQVWRDQDADDLPADDAKRISIWAVAGVTVANGADNIGAYVPALARYSTPTLIAIAVLFLVLVAPLCLIGYYLAAHRWAAAAMRRWGHVVYPIALIVIGLAVLVSGHAFGI